MKPKRNRQNYPKEFRDDAVKLVIEKGYKSSEVGRRLGINLFRAAAVRKAVNYDNADHSKIKSALNHAIFCVKEHFKRIFGPLNNFFNYTQSVMSVCS